MRAHKRNHTYIEAEFVAVKISVNRLFSRNTIAPSVFFPHNQVSEDQ